jgi:NAD(P)-dependent dehydrogenase (short-subunit alcohol dehydrogenase family)
MTGLLEGKVTVITGAGSGVGRATSLLFATQGANVVCGDLRKAWVDDTVALVTEAGGQATAVECDVTSETDVQELIAAARRTYGRVDVVFNNAGISTPGLTVEGHTDEIWDRLMDVNVRGVLYGCKHAVIAFKEQGDGGAIINTSSIAGLVGIGGFGYGASKGAVTQLTRVLAIEVAPLMIRVNSIAPGFMLTNLTKSEEEAFSENTEEERAVRPHEPDAVPGGARAHRSAALFASDRHHGSVTGVALPVDAASANNRFEHHALCRRSTTDGGFS